MKLLIIITIMLSTNIAKAEMMLDEWLAINEPKAMNYMNSLSSSDEGKHQSGITFMDGSCEFEGYTYIKKVVLRVSEHQIYTFLDKNNEPVAFIWVSEGGEPLPLPECIGNDPRYKWPGWSGSDLAGEVYTYPEVHPGYGVVKTRCIPKAWLK